MTFEDWLADHEGLVDTFDQAQLIEIAPFLQEAFMAGQRAERQACARLCEEGVDTEHPTVEGHVMKNFGASTHLANAIRGRGEK